MFTITVEVAQNIWIRQIHNNDDGGLHIEMERMTVIE